MEKRRPNRGVSLPNFEFDPQLANCKAQGVNRKGRNLGLINSTYRQRGSCLRGVPTSRKAEKSLELELAISNKVAWMKSTRVVYGEMGPPETKRVMQL